MSKKKTRQKQHPQEWDVSEKKTSVVVRVGIAILGLAVAISSLLPILSFFQR